MKLSKSFGSSSALSGLLCLLPALGCSQASSGASPATGGSPGSSGGSAGQVSTGGTQSASGAPGTAGSGNVGTAGAAAGAATTGGASNGAGAGGAPSGGAPGTAGGASAGSGGGGTAGAPAVCAPPTVSLSGADAVVGGKLITFNDNGGWCWYQDERAVVDTKGNKLILGSVASGGSRNGYIEAVVYDIAAGTKKLSTLGTGLASNVDDHNAPAFLVRPDGKYFAMWSGHRTDCLTRRSTFDGSAWSTELTYDWKANGCPWAGASTNMVTYSNPWYIGTSIYAGVRSIGTDPAVLTSADNGQTLSFYGRLMSSGQVGYVAGYGAGARADLADRRSRFRDE